MQIIENKKEVDAQKPRQVNYFQDPVWQGGLPKELIVKIFLELLNQKYCSTRQLIESVKDIVLFGTVCRKVHIYYFESRIWEIALKLFPHFKINKSLNIKYYDSFKKNIAPIFNIYKNKKSINIIKDDFYISHINEVIIICKEEKECFVYNSFDPLDEKEQYKLCSINRDLIDSIYLKRFLIKKYISNGFYSNIKIIDFIYEKKIVAKLNGIINGHAFQLNNTNINIVPNTHNFPLQDFLCFGNKFLFTLEEDIENKSQIDMKIFDIETGKLFKTKKNIINSSIEQTVSIFCKPEYESVLCLMYNIKEETQANIVVYDLEYDIEYNYTTNITTLYPYVNSNYIVYIGGDNVITFIDRKTGNKKWVDLEGEKNNCEAMIELHEGRFFNLQCSISNDKFIYIASKDNMKIKLWDLQFGKELLNPAYEMVLSNTPFAEISYNISNNHICIHNEVEHTETFFDLQLVEKFQQEKHTCSFHINDHLRFINIPNNGYMTIYNSKEIIQIYDSNLDKFISINPSFVIEQTTFDVEVNSLWGNFLAIAAKSHSPLLSIFIFDLDTGESVSSVSLNKFFEAQGWECDTVQITKIQWKGGLLSVTFDVTNYHSTEDNEDSEDVEENRVLYINFHNRFPFPNAVVDL